MNVFPNVILHLTDEKAQLRNTTKNRRQICLPTLSQLKSDDPEIRHLPLAVYQNYLRQSRHGIMAFQKQVQHRLFIWNKNIRPLGGGGF